MAEQKKNLQDSNPHHDFVPGKRWMVWLGHLFVGLGFAGVALPIMPGVVFFIIAAYFYARSSRKFYNWLMNHKHIGVHIRNYQARKITLRGKILSIASMTFAIALSVFGYQLGILGFDIPLWVKIILIVCNVGVSIYILRFKTA